MPGTQVPSNATSIERPSAICGSSSRRWRSPAPRTSSRPSFRRTLWNTYNCFTDSLPATSSTWTGKSPKKPPTGRHVESTGALEPIVSLIGWSPSHGGRMSHRAVACRFGAGWFVGLLALVAGPVDAQRGILRAIVVDSLGVPIPGVEASIYSLSRTTRSDSAGHFTFAVLPEGGFDVALRRLGYHAYSQHVVITGAPYDCLTIMLAAQPVALSEVDISAGERHPFFQGVDQPQRQGIGTFPTRAQIDAPNTLTPTHLFPTLPHVTLVRTNS